ncbi:MAG: hypothetical protein WKG01_37695 [Kofleriaceae bacterium]
MPAGSPALSLVALVIVIGVVIANAQLVAGGHTWGDARYHTEVAPPRLAAADAVLGGELPGWWDGAGLGEALAGEPSHGALYPAHWIAATSRVLDLVAIAHLAWLALGIALWARRSSRVAATGASEPAALVVGLLAVTSGLLASAAVRGALPALAHLPWIALAAGWLAGATDRKARARATIALAGLLGLVALSGVLAGLGHALALAVIVGGRKRCARYLAGAIAAGLAIGAIQWLPAVPDRRDCRGRGARLAARAAGRARPPAASAQMIRHAIAAVAGDLPWAPSHAGAPLLALAAYARRRAACAGS